MLKISRDGLVVGGIPDMVLSLGEFPIWFVAGGSPEIALSLGKSRDCFVAGGSPDIVWLLGEVPIWFGCWGKSRDVTSRHSCGEILSCFPIFYL